MSASSSNLKGPAGAVPEPKPGGMQTIRMSKDHTMPATPEHSKPVRKPQAMLATITWLVGIAVLALGFGWLYWYVAVERNELPWGALLLIPCVAVIAAVTFRNHFSR
jgi:hypothetical protein